MSQSISVSALHDLIATIQHNRLLQIKFPFEDGPGALIFVQSLDGFEQLSQDFCYTVKLLSPDPKIALKEMIGKLVVIELLRSDKSVRRFSGYVFDFKSLGSDGGLASYTMTLRPWTAFMAYRQDCFIFHNMNVQDQFKTLISEYGALPDFEFRLVGEDPAMTDAIQYNETDYNYFHRRFENNGWYYWYEHTEDGKHKLVVHDLSKLAKPIDGNEHVKYQNDTGSANEDMISVFNPVRCVASTSVTVESFDFKVPRPVGVNEETTNVQGRVPNLEIYESLGAYGFPNTDVAQALANKRIQAIQSKGKHFEGISQNPYLQPGRAFTLDNEDFKSQLHSQDEDDLSFLILSVHHTARNNIEVNGQSETTYQNEFTCIRRAITWRPALTHTNTINAPQTAMVTGPGNQEIHTDEYGRVRVQFHWDRVGVNDERSSAWIRVASGWAGQNFGEMALPRIGQEVIVEFLNGNTDRPIITGRVYNETHMPPYALPAQKALMVVKSKEVEGRRKNQLRLDDTPGEISAQVMSDHGQSQLNLGYLTHERSGGKGEYRGEGAELRTDHAAAIRAKQGVFISTDPRENAGGDQLGRNEIQGLLKALEGIENQLQDLSKRYDAETDDADTKVFKDAIQKLDDWKKNGGAPLIAMSGQDSIAVGSQNGVQVAAQTNIDVMAGQHTQISSGKSLALRAKEGLTAFVHHLGMRLVAAAGNIKIVTHDGSIEIVSSNNITITAKEKITLNAPVIQQN
ncbi:MAG: type VI secretion system tip protein VgrG, partial [Burkholderiales bacterium]|nr:type VI secretion system tip protein VgrG [Burkholderiales bacterium]